MEDLLKIIQSVKKRDEDYQRRKRGRRNGCQESEVCDDNSDDNDDDDFDNDSDSSFDTQESEKRYSNRHNAKQEQKHVQKVHGELCDINKKLQQENNRLKSWDMELQKRESKLDGIEKQLSAYASSLKDTVEKETLKRCAELEKGYEIKLHQLQEESKKTRNSLKITKKANDVLKVKVAESESKLKKYEDKQSSSQSRISNLQRKIELLNQQINEQATDYNNSLKEKVKVASKTIKDDSSIHTSLMFYEIFASLLQWISNAHLKQNVTSIIKNRHQLQTEDDTNIQQTNERTLKMIIFMPNVLPQVSSMNSKLQLSFVQFLYWSMLHLHATQYSQRLSHSATYRRIGEELFQSNVYKQGRENKAFFKSPDFSTRILSSLIILHTVNQADILVNVFQSLCVELKAELAKELFLEYHGTEILFPLFKLTNKMHLGYSTDILMLLAVDSPYMNQFLSELSTIEWVEAIMTILKASVDITLMENLSLILQRLSKVKSIKPIFAALQVKSNVTEMLKHPSFDGEYLQLNLRSILLNIESMRTQEK